MISVQEKLNVYREYLQRKFNEQETKEISEAEEYAQNERAAFDVKLAEQVKALSDHAQRIRNRDVTKIVAEGKTYQKDCQLRLQSEILKEFTQEILDQINHYFGTRDYYNYIENCIRDFKEQNLPKSKLNVAIRPVDEHIFEESAKKELPGFSFDFTALPAKSYGGFLITAEEGRVSYDYTISNLVADNRKFIGIELKKAMEGASL